MDVKAHWETIHRSKAPSHVSRFLNHPALSANLIKSTCAGKSSEIIDVGGGASTLVDDILAEGFKRLNVLDISASALRIAQRRLGDAATQVNWIEADITRVKLPRKAYDIWHDRAVFHFLTQPHERKLYVRALQHSLKSGGYVIVATFALDRNAAG